MSVKILGTEPAYEGWITVRVATLAGPDGETFEREVEDHGDGVAVLPYDPDRRVALLVRLPRETAQGFAEAGYLHLRNRYLGNSLHLGKVRHKGPSAGDSRAGGQPLVRQRFAENGNLLARGRDSGGSGGFARALPHVIIVSERSTP